MDRKVNLAFVRAVDGNAVESATKIINRTRTHKALYEHIIRTSARRNWVALLIESETPDFYLLRNLSGRLSTISFQLCCDGLRLAYRVHREGRTVGAYESHLNLWMTQQLRLAVNIRDVNRIDLAEPAGRLILQEYHEHQRLRPWTTPSFKQTLPHPVEQFYAGNVQHLRDFLKPDVDLAYLQTILHPGFSVDEALERLLHVLNLPYLPDDTVEIERSEPEKGIQVIEGHAILDTATWHEKKVLPKGWAIIDYNSWIETET